MPGAGAVHAVFMLDLNGFKRINDMYGHPAGDEALVQTAIQLRKAMRDADMVARLGGDEFAVLALHLSGAEAATSLALRIIDALKAPVPAGGAEHVVGAGVGIALAPVDGTDADTLLRKADVALYRAKAEGVSALRFFEAEMDRHIRERDRLERDLRTAIGTDALTVLHAPRVDLQSGTIASFEAAPRWIHPELGELDAVRLFPIAENSGLTRLVLEDLLRRACRDALEWDDRVTLSFAMPSSLLRDSALGTRVLTILGEAGLAPGRLELEIPESVLVAELEAAQRALGAIHAAGGRLALSNFGTGYSSLYHLRNFKLDTIKIDRSFVQAMTESPESAAIVRALVGLGSGLGLTVAAEGVLDATQQSILASEGCQQAQGALFSRTLSADGALALLQTYARCADRLRAAASQEEAFRSGGG